MTIARDEKPVYAKSDMDNFFDTFMETWLKADTIVGFILSVVLIFVLYVIALIERKLRLIEHELQEMKKDQTVMSDELEIVATSRSPGKVA